MFILGIRESALDRRKKLPKGYLTRDVLGIDEQVDRCPEKGNCLPGIVEKNVDSKYYVSEDIEKLLEAWEEFRANVKGLCSPFWLHKAGIGIYSREQYYHDSTIGYQDMPEWKKIMVMRSRVMYENNSEFIDAWIDKHNMQAKSLIHQKFEWNCGTDCKSIKEGIIQIRQSGVRVKRPNYFPSLVAMNNTPTVYVMRFPSI